MAKNNAINSDIKATNAEALAGSSTRNWMTPKTCTSAFNARRLTPPIQNLGFTLTLGAFAVTSQNGSALSSSNAGVVIIPSKLNPGQFVRYVITANQSIAGSNVTSSATWGLGASTAVAYPQDMFVYAVPNAAEDDVAFMISRIPHATVSPTASFIGVPSNVTNVTTQGSFLSLKAITAANYASNPCVCIGSTNMSHATTGNPWVFNALSSDNGVGLFADNTLTVLPANQFGAPTSKWFLNNGGTAAQFTTSRMTYHIDRFGFCLLNFDFSANIAGAGAVNAQMVLPFVPETAGRSLSLCRTDSATSGTRPAEPYLTTGAGGVGVSEFYISSSGLPLLYSFSLTGVIGIIQYKVSSL